MKHIQRIKPISLKDPATGEVVKSVPALSHERWVNNHPLADKKFVANFKAIMAGGRIQAAFEGTSQEIALEDDHYDMLKAALENPEPMVGQQMTPEMARQYLPFMAAIMSATDKPVKKPKAKKAAKKSPKNGKGKASAKSPSDAGAQADTAVN